MSVRLTTDQLKTIREHGERTFPEECGGLLLGTVEDSVRLIQDVLPRAIFQCQAGPGLRLGPVPNRAPKPAGNQPHTIRLSRG